MRILRGGLALRDALSLPGRDDAAPCGPRSPAAAAADSNAQEICVVRFAWYFQDTLIKTAS